jgi:tripartite-type tricarboxylate transporter receptor subunit TctC
MTSRRRFIAAGGALAATATIRPGWAQTLSSQPLRSSVGFAVGGGTDSLARALADALKTAYPAGVIVDNQGRGLGPARGERGEVGRARTAAPCCSRPTSRSRCTRTPSPSSNTTRWPTSCPWRWRRKSGYALCAGPAVPANVTTTREWLEWVKANPSQNSYGSSGAGTTLHLAGAMLERASGVKLNHVPYKGGALSLQDVMGGQIPVSINAVGEALPFQQGGRIRVIGTFGARRNPFLPNVPTMVDAGYADVVSEAWLAFLLPAKTPQDIATRIAAAINKATESQELKDRFAKFGMETVTGTPAQLAALIESDTRRWGPVVKATGFRAED